MHKTAFDNAAKFRTDHVKQSGLKVLDVGSLDVSNQSKKYGSLRELFFDCEYVGMDICPGKNVDVVLEGKTFPFDDEIFDVIVSTSCFEHDTTFWITFSEMVRVLKKGGLIYLNAPSAGYVHRYPVDCYRFYPDFANGLAEWQKLELLEQYIDQNCFWKNNVGVFRK